MFAGAVLLVIYGATLAPDATWWDSGEMIAAAHSLGIPHPPGVPLYVLLANVASRAFWWMGPAASVNFLSALCVAGACALGAAMITSVSRSVVCGIGAALCAGSAATVWLTATEAEVYGPALLLSALMLWSGMKAGENGEQRWVNLSAYFIALAAPLHLSALVAAPAAIVFAAWNSDGHVNWRRALLLTGVLLCSAGAGKASLPLVIAGLLIIVANTAAADGHVTQGFAVIALVALAASCLLFMPLRAAWDPIINQGNPVTAQALTDVLGRHQYDVAPIFPRQAPFWLQIANYFQYLDWQFALGIAPTVLPSMERTFFGLLFLLLACVGLWHLGSASARVQWALFTLFASASAGVVAYLNFKAGPTIGIGLIPDGAPHEARERDYFFLLSFWTLALLAGTGAASLGSRLRRFAVPSGIALAALPFVLNFSAVNRRTEPDASLPRRLASAMLETMPANAVLFVAGDNDTYPAWYMQSAHNLRRDVTVITIPLLGADWYRAELQRRHNLAGGARGQWAGMGAALREVAERARNQGRPVAVAVTVPADERLLLGSNWVLTGFHYRPASEGEIQSGAARESLMDEVALERAARIGERGVSERVRPAVDPIARQMARILECPGLALDWLRGTAGKELLDSSCNFR